MDRHRPLPVRGLLLARGIWLGAVADTASIRFNLRLLTVLTALFSLPEIAQGLTQASQGSPAGRAFGGYVLLLGSLELLGAGLLALRRPAGCRLIGAAACGFYPEAVLGVASFERAPLAVAIYVVCVPAEAWVLWFVTHRRVHAYMRAQWRRRGMIS